MDVATQKVTFAVKDTGQFDLKAIKGALARQGFNQVRLVKGPA